MENPKVFEFAKSMGLETLALMEKLRAWNIPVKNHMAELDSATIQLIQTKMKESSTPEKEGSKKTVKKTPAKAAAKKTAAEPEKKAAAKAAPKAAPRPANRPAAAKKAAPGKATEEEAAAPKSGSRVIRRKAGSVPPPVAAEELPPIPSEVEIPDESPAIERAEVPPVVTPMAASPAAQAPTPVGVTAPAAPAVAAPTASAPVAEEPPRPTRVVRREVIMDPSKPVSSGVSSTPKSPSNIVGRMDLSRAHAMQKTYGRGPSGPGGGGGGGYGSRPGGGGYSPRPGGGTFGGYSGGQAGTGGRPTGARGFRTGFVAPQPDVFAAMDEEARRKEKLRKAKGIAEGAAPEKEEEIQAFNPTEFRKRELVFQPKKKKTSLGRPSMKTEITKPKASKRIVRIHDRVKVSDFAQEMGLKATQIISHLMKNGMMVTLNDSIDFDTAALMAPDFGFEVVNEKKSIQELAKEVAFGDLGAEPVHRPPVVTVMGHVDHGKTSLLDAIRQANVASKEAGGITQHIGAYSVSLQDGRQITFIDTPGHEAFTAMRARGATVTDIVILVVAADDGVMKQTQEAISHAKAAGVPIIVAMNKMDKPGANPDRIKQQLTEYELVAEEWGGQTVFMPVSALKKTGIKELLESVLLQAEVMELRANPKRSATGVVIEARLDKGRGPVVTLLVKDGTLRKGEYVSAGTAYGRVRALSDDQGKPVESVGPGMPVELLGLGSVPNAGDLFDVCPDEDAASQLAKSRQEAVAKTIETPKPKVSLEELFSKVQTGDVKELPIIVKADVAGSLEAIKGLLAKLPEDKVKIRVVHSGIGGINESDVLLSSSAKGIVVGFNVRPDAQADSLAKQNGVEIKCYSVIYELVDEMKKAMEGLLAPQVVEKTMGRAQVRDLFSIPKIGVIAGCSVTDGKIFRSNFVRLIRDSRVIYEGKISSLKRFKDDAREVAQGFECGIGIENYNDLKVGDVIEAFEKQEIASTL